MTLPEEMLNGIPWELCSLIAVTLRAEKPLKWEVLIPDIEREKRFWMTQGFSADLIPATFGTCLGRGRYLA